MVIFYFQPAVPLLPVQHQCVCLFVVVFPQDLVQNLYQWKNLILDAH